MALLTATSRVEHPAPTQHKGGCSAFDKAEAMHRHLRGSHKMAVIAEDLKFEIAWYASLVDAHWIAHSIHIQPAWRKANSKIGSIVLDGKLRVDSLNCQATIQH